MTPTPSRLRRGVLRTIVFLQLAVLAVVGSSVYEFVTSGSDVTPGAVVLVASMLAGTLLALRVSFLPAAGTRAHRIAFMAVQSLVALAPLVGRASLGFVLDGSVLPRFEGVLPEILLGMMSLELLLAAVLAGVSALLAPLLLTSVTDSTDSSRFARRFGVWAGVAVLAVTVVSVAYHARFAQMQAPSTRVRQLLDAGDPDLQKVAAVRLAAMDLSAQPEVRSALFDGLAAKGVNEQAWAAYVLIASGADDGRAMQLLRRMTGTFVLSRAVETLAMLGAAAAPALPELTSVIRNVTDTELVASVQTNAAHALGGIGAPALGTVPWLLEHARDERYPDLRTAAAHAIDRIDPGFARRCAVDAATMKDALDAADFGPLTIRPECLPAAASPPGVPAERSASSPVI